MKFYEFEAEMKRFECRSATIPPDTWVVLHVDGDNFHAFVKEMGYARPFDVGFHERMESVGRRLLEAFTGVYAYLQSDEVNLLLPPTYAEFSRDLAKIVSKSVAVATSHLTLEVGRSVGFATHVYALPNEKRVVDYFRWRQSDCFRNCYNAYCYWTERKNGLSPSRATKKFDGVNVMAKIQYLRDVGITSIPAWQRWGTGLRWERYAKRGHNPITKEDVTCERRRIKVEEELPHGDDYAAFVLGLLNGSAGSRS